MKEMSNEILLEEVQQLITDFRTHYPSIIEQLTRTFSPHFWKSIEKVYITGAGDSFFAAQSMAFAFRLYTNVPCFAIGPQYFMDYELSYGKKSKAKETLLIAISASGKTKIVIDAIELAQQSGIGTIAILGTSENKIALISNEKIIVKLQKKQRSPGLRSYQASLLAILLIAMHISVCRNSMVPKKIDEIFQEIEQIPIYIDLNNEILSKTCVALIQQILDFETFLFLGNGPNLGTAHYCAAKIIETTGFAAMGGDNELWWHRERFIKADKMPLFVLAPPDQHLPRNILLVQAAQKLGKKCIIITSEKDVFNLSDKDFILPIRGKTMEVLSPLLYYPFTAYLGTYLANKLSRRFFQSNPTNFVK